MPLAPCYVLSMDIIDEILTLAEAYKAHKGWSLSYTSMKCTTYVKREMVDGVPKFVVKHGSTSVLPTLKKHDENGTRSNISFERCVKIKRWFDENWCDDLPYPDGVTRSKVGV